MKYGKNLNELAAEVMRQTEAKRDLVAPVTAVEVLNPNAMSLQGIEGALTIGGETHHQIATDAGIPLQFYDRLRAQHPDLYTNTVNTLVRAIPAPKGQPVARRMVRTIDGNARAWLSDSYRPLDNYELLNAALPTLSEFGDALQFRSMELTARKLYLKVITRELSAEVVGKEVRGGVIISNSETGYGRIMVAPFSEVLYCTNGAVHMEYGMGKRHAGRRSVTGEGNGEDEAFEFFTDETRRKDDEAFFMKVRDLIKATLSSEVFGRVVNGMREAAGVKITGSVEKGVEVLAKRYQMTEGERSDVLRHLIEGGDLSMWGVHNAVTRAAADVESYDRATELESIGGQLLTLPAADIKPILMAA